MIRTADIGDSSEIAHVITETWKTAYVGIIHEEYPHKMEVNFFKKIIEKNITFEREIIYVYEIDKQIVGFISGRKIDISSFEVIGFYVLPAHQGKGLGQTLFNKIREHSKSINCSLIRLKTLHGARNNSFYEKNGLQNKKNIALELDGNVYDGIEYYLDN